MTARLPHLVAALGCGGMLVVSLGLAAEPGTTAADVVRESGVRGGLIAHVNCGDATLTPALRVSDAFVVHGLEAKADHVAAARERLQAAGQAGAVTVELWPANWLPYADNLVNLIVVSRGAIEVPEAELLRVLAPGGVAVRLAAENRRPAGETSLRKPWPEEMGDWTHYQFDANNNAVGTDRLVGPPQHFQWSGGPLWSTAHENMASLNAMVSARGRVFYIMDEGPRASSLLPADWQLIARDGFNGVILWKRPIQRWLTRQWPWKSGPAQMPRKLIAVDDKVYAPLDINGPLLQLDAATGATLHTYEGTAAAEEVVCSHGVLLIVTNPAPPDQDAIDAERRQRRHFDYDAAHSVLLDHDIARTISAFQADTGELLWRHDGPRVLPLTLAADGQIAAYHQGQRIVARDLLSGAERWSSEPITGRLRMASEDAPTLVLHDQVCLLAWNRKLTAVSKQDGRTLWSCNWTQSDYRSPVSVMVLGGLVWSMDITGVQSPGTFVGREPLTGEVKQQFQLPPFQGIGHHRCYKAKATGDCVLLSRSGVEYVDPFRQTYLEHHWVRGACLYGILACNGLLYATPHPCACYIKGKLSGFVAMAPRSRGNDQGGGPDAAEGTPAAAERLERGPAYGSANSARSAARFPLASDWPTYRHDPSRSGSAMTRVPTDLKRTWRTQLGGQLTSVTVAAGKVFVARRDGNTVYALDAGNGEVAWSFVAGAAVDSPPTLHLDRAYFGCADGYVYCLRSEDGALCWRFRAAPEQRRAVAFGRVESVWPVHGSVLVMGDTVYCAAGRSSFLDGGIQLIKLDAATGRLLGSAVVHDLDPVGKQPALQGSFDMEGSLPDILSCDGESCFMRHRRFDLETLELREPSPHLFAPAGYLDDTWWHRTYWVYGADTRGGYGGWWQAGNKLPAGRILVADRDSVFGFGRSYYPGMNSAQFSRGEKYLLFATDKTEGAEPDYRDANRLRGQRRDLEIDWSTRRTVQFRWAEELPFQVQALVLAERTLFAAGPYGDGVHSLDAYEGRRGVRLAAVSADSGQIAASYQLDALPVFDGMAAVQGSLFLALKDGSVQCLGSEGQPLPAVTNEAIERIEERLLPTDAEDAEIMRSFRQQSADKPAARQPLAGKSLASEFDRLADGQIVESPLGYRLGANSQQVALAPGQARIVTSPQHHRQERSMTRSRTMMLSAASIVLLLACSWLPSTHSVAAAVAKPNVIVIFTDDHGWADLGSQGVRQDIRTPHLDALAAGGVRAVNGYVTAPQCVPSRAGLLSGRYQNRFGVESNGMPLAGFNAQATLAERLKQAGYATGMAGKWHLGPAQEITEHGFDDVFCNQGGQGRAWANFDLAGNAIPAGEIPSLVYHLDANSAAACAFIQRHADEPFFFYLAYRGPHTPLDAPAKYTSRFPGPMPERRRQALAMISAIDDGVGRVVETLREHQLEERTLLFFLGDNGAPLKIHKPDSPLDQDAGGWDGSLNDPLNGEKGMLSEGGIRVPWLAYWKGTIPGGQVYEHPVISLDIAATAIALAGQSHDAQLDGVDLLPYFTGKSSAAPHEALTWRWVAQSAVREGQWKLLVGGPRSYLFDLNVDPEEKRNLIAQHPEIAERLRGRLESWAAELQVPGIHIQPMAKTWEQYFDFYLDGKPAPPGDSGSDANN